VKYIRQTISARVQEDFRQTSSASKLLSFTASATHPQADPWTPIGTMASSSTSVGRRQADWADFYKNGVPKEVIVIDDDTPPPPPSLSTSSTSSSASGQHVPNGHPMASPRYRVEPSQPHHFHHAGNSSSQMGLSSMPIPIPDTAERTTKRTNKRGPSSDLAPHNINGASSHPSNQYVYSQSSYAPMHLNNSHRPIYLDTRPDTGTSPNGSGAPPAKKKRRSNPDVKCVQPRAAQEQQAHYQPPNPKSQVNAPLANRNVREDGALGADVALVVGCCY
jgi:dual-specificity kinase